MKMRWLVLVLALIFAGCVTSTVISAAGATWQPPDPVWTVAPATLSGASGTQGTFTWTGTVPTAEAVNAVNVAWQWPVPANAKFISGSLERGAWSLSSTARWSMDGMPMTDDGTVTVTRTASSTLLTTPGADGLVKAAIPTISIGETVTIKVTVEIR